MLTTIKFTGILKDKFISEFQAKADNLQQLMSCIYVNFPEFKSYILAQEYLYEIYISKGNLTQQVTEDNLPNISMMPLAGATVIISPAIAGSGENTRGYLQSAILIGLGLIPGNPFAAGLIGAGISTGLQTLLYGFPGKPKKEESTVFFQSSGAVTEEGTPVQLVFGEALVKSFQVISLDVRSEYKKL